MACTRLSLYTDDAILIIKPVLGEIVTVKELLKCFGAASGLVCNFAKSSLSLIRCTADDTQHIIAIAGYLVKDLPITYLGLPLSL